MRTLQELRRDRSGTTSIEYALIAGLIAVGMITTVNTVGDRLGDVMTAVMEATMGPPPGNSPNAP